jgi:hypothetical protein
MAEILPFGMVSEGKPRYEALPPSSQTPHTHTEQQTLLPTIVSQKSNNGAQLSLRSHEEVT